MIPGDLTLSPIGDRDGTYEIDLHGETRAPALASSKQDGLDKLRVMCERARVDGWLVEPNMPAELVASFRPMQNL